MLAARFDDLRSGEAWRFPVPDRVVVARTPEEVIPALAAVEEATNRGTWAYGFVGYEAAPAFDPVLTVHPGPDELPLVWFALCEPPELGEPPALCEPPGSGRLDLGLQPEGQATRVSPWTWDWSAADHAARVAAVHDAIAAGETYQCNLTTRLRAQFTGNPAEWYQELGQQQRGGFHALLDTGDHTIVSASPECFFVWEGDRLAVVPMKGTASRSADPVRDRARRDALLGSAKERAENVMIVDLIRNDLSRIAEPGTVRTERLLDCEEYDTVWQLTSTVTGRLPATTGLGDIFAALFPCGSITGAPKPRTMQLITELEDSPRGIYCGAVGWVAPPGSPVRARFGVAIRTAVINNTNGDIVYGVGGAVTWDSTAADEYAELHAKAKIVMPRDSADSPAPDGPGLIETFAVHDHLAPHLDHHLARLRRSATELGLGLDHDQLRATVERALAGPDGVARLLLRPNGDLDLTVRPLPASTATPVRLALDTVPTAQDSVLVRHKTTLRDRFDDARRRHPDAEDVIGINGLGHLTETTIANLAVEIDGQWCTPPVSDGLLPGVGRELLLASGQLVERSIPATALTSATRVAVISSVRGWRPATLVDRSAGR